MAMAVSQRDGNDCHLVLVRDSDFLLHVEAAIRSGTAFNFSITPEELRLNRGLHLIDAYAFDRRRTVAQPVSIALQVLAPTVPPQIHPIAAPRLRLGSTADPGSGEKAGKAVMAVRAYPPHGK
jgi:hypothetical protein